MNAMLCAMSWSLLFQLNLYPGNLSFGGGYEFRGPATVEVIDVGNRIVTVKDKDAHYHIIHASLNIDRFDELKVGDTRTFRSTEPMICDMRRDEEPVPGPSGSSAATLAQAGCEGRKRDGTPKLLQSAKVIVRMHKVQWLTVEFDDGRTMLLGMTRTAGTTKFRKSVAEGDHLVITYELSEMRKIGKLQKKPER